MPLILGEDRLIPGFEANIVGLRPGESTEFDITFPEDYAGGEPRRPAGHFHVDLKELREKVLPPADDDFARNMGEYADLDALKADVDQRLRRNALDRARHEFADKIIEYAVANSTIELPEILVDQEVEVMHDEFRSQLARQGIGEEAYLKATGQSEADLHAEFRPRAEQRTKVLLVLSKIADAEGIEIPDAEVEAQVERPARATRIPRPPVLRVRARPQLHPQHAPADPARGDARGPLAGRPSRAPAAAAHGGRRAVGRRRRPG